MRNKTNESLIHILEKKISKRKEANNFRQLRNNLDLRDFSSNDYLGFARSAELYSLIKQYEEKYPDLVFSGAGASRLITGNHELYDIAEKNLSEFYNSQKVLIFNSGYDANIGLFSCLCDRNDTILFDEQVHASIRDGVRLSHARAFSFRHNDLDDLKKKVLHAGGKYRGNIVVVVESVYSMEGIKKNSSGKYILEDIIDFCYEKGIYVIVDEAHSTGVYGKLGEGLILEKNLQNKVFARIHTFGKALGVHGAAITCSTLLYDYLVNFARSFIYTTALPPHSLISILAAHDFLKSAQPSIKHLRENIAHFQKTIFNKEFAAGNDSAIFKISASGNENAKELAQQCMKAGFDIRAILSPTVSAGNEMVRVCLHSFNTAGEIDELMSIFSKAYHNGIAN